MNYNCKHIQYLDFFNCTETINGIVTKPDFAFIDLFSTKNIILSQKQKKEKNNVYYEQEIDITINYKDISDIKITNESLLIVRITKEDNTTITWGTLSDDFNPVQVEISTENKTCKITLSRISRDIEF